MKRILKIFGLLFLPCFMMVSCSSKGSENKNNNKWPQRPEEIEFKAMGPRGGMPGSSGQESIGIENYVKYVALDDIENHSVAASVSIYFKDKSAIIDGKNASKEGLTIYTDADGKDVKVYVTDDVSGKDAEAQGVIIEYKGKEELKYILSGNLSGTLKIKNKNADCIVQLNGVNITSSKTGPALHITSEENKTFIYVADGTENTLVDNRLLNQSVEMMNDKKGSIYAKGALIFTGATSQTAGGKLSVVNKGYKHAIYSHDYIRIQNVSLEVICSGETSRDCIRTLNAVIIDDGKINLVSNGIIEDDEGCGIKVEGEDADEDKMTVEYTAGAGFIVINGGTITSKTTSKGITAHWKKAESVIGKEGYTETKNKSALYGTGILNGDAETPQPYLVINGGTINLTTTLTPYETKDASCSPEGLEAKLDVVINSGTIVLNTTDDSINAGGAITINGGALSVTSLNNDAMDANGPAGITINGGNVIASGVSMPECAFDCDNNPFTVNGGTIIGFGTGNYTTPSADSTQNVLVLGSSNYAGKVLTVKQDGKNVYSASIPSNAGEVIILSSSDIKTGSIELYADEIKVASATVEGSVTLIDVKSAGFGGGRGGFGPGEFGGSSFGENGGNPPSFPDGFNPEDFKGQRPEGMTPPEGFGGKRPN